MAMKGTKSFMLASNPTASPADDIAATRTRQLGAAEPTATLGRYRVLKTLGQGGMGAVYLAEDTRLQRLVALKAPFFTESEEEVVKVRFMREARAAAQLSRLVLRESLLLRPLAKARTLDKVAGDVDCLVVAAHLVDTDNV